MENNQIDHRKSLKGLTVVGKIKLASPKKAKRKFVPFSGGFRLGEVLRPALKAQ